MLDSCLERLRYKEPEADEDKTEEEEEGVEEETLLFLFWLIGGHVFSSLRCLLETRREPMSCSRDPGVDI